MRVPARARNSSIADAPRRAASSRPVSCSVDLNPFRALRGRSGNQVGPAVERGDQPFDALILEDCGEFPVAGRHLADRAVEIDVGNQPALAVAPHHVVDLDRVAIGLHDLAGHKDPNAIRLFAGDLQFLSGIAVEAVGIDRRDVARKALADLLALRLAEIGPVRADRQTGHRRNIEGPADDRFELHKAPALPEGAAVFHDTEQRVIKALHRIPGAGGSGYPGSGPHRQRKHHYCPNGLAPQAECAARAC
jgi:hypothetical protein